MFLGGGRSESTRIKTCETCENLKYRKTVTPFPTWNSLPLSSPTNIIMTILTKITVMIMIMISVKETARKITCPTERRDEREAHREVPERCSERKVLDRDQQIPSVRERVHRHRLRMTTPNVQEHKRWSYAVEYRDSLCLVKNTAVSKLEFCRSRIIRPDNWNFSRVVTKHLLKELGYEVALMNHVHSQSAKTWASTRGLGRMKHVLPCSNPCFHWQMSSASSPRRLARTCTPAFLMTKCHTLEAHMKGCAMISLKNSRDDGRLGGSSHSDVRSGQNVSKPQGGVRRITHVFQNFTVSREFTFGDKLVPFCFFVFLPMNNQLTRRPDKEI